MHRPDAPRFTLTTTAALLMLAASAAQASNPDQRPGNGAHYLKLRPDLIVNLQDRSRARFLMLTVAVRGEDDAALRAVKHHMPALRHRLLLLLSTKQPHDLTAPGAVESARREALAAVREVLIRETGKPEVRELYFTDLIVE